MSQTTELYRSSACHQLFKSTLNDRVLQLEITENGLFRLESGFSLSMSEMINTYWTPIETSEYLGALE